MKKGVIFLLASLICIIVAWYFFIDFASHLGSLELPTSDGGLYLILSFTLGFLLLFTNILKLDKSKLLTLSKSLMIAMMVSVALAPFIALYLFTGFQFGISGGLLGSLILILLIILIPVISIVLTVLFDKKKSSKKMKIATIVSYVLFFMYSFFVFAGLIFAYAFIRAAAG
tara:strand:+ start:45 stop:557 length:513 start_codon:yes stop_codon:yes gene_type:complete